jgi:hypothetical protein
VLTSLSRETILCMGKRWACLHQYSAVTPADHAHSCTLGHTHLKQGVADEQLGKLTASG